MLIGTVGQTIILEVAQDADGWPSTAPTVAVVNAATGASILAIQTMTLDGTVWKYAWDTTGLGTSYLQARALYVVDGEVYPEPIQLNAVSGGGGGMDLTTTFEGSYTLQDFFRLASSVLFGKTTAGGARFRDLGDTKDRIQATLNASNERTTMTLDPD